ncbi:MAG: hypothetical protein QXX20_06195 [Candidatus Thermoplasmatota archaeon]
MVDLPIFFLISGAGIILTIIILKTAEKKTTSETSDSSTSCTVKLFGMTLSIVVLLYLFRLVMIAAAGLISQSYWEVIIGIFCAFLPVLGLKEIRTVISRFKEP